jgi:hypothetical protein
MAEYDWEDDDDEATGSASEDSAGDAVDLDSPEARRAFLKQGADAGLPMFADLLDAFDRRAADAARAAELAEVADSLDPVSLADLLDRFDVMRFDGDEDPEAVRKVELQIAEMKHALRAQVVAARAKADEFAMTQMRKIYEAENYAPETVDQMMATYRDELAALQVWQSESDSLNDSETWRAIEFARGSKARQRAVVQDMIVNREIGWGRETEQAQADIDAFVDSLAEVV